MSFSGKSTYTAGATLPEIAEDVADLVSINSPHETPLLDALGDPAHPSRSTVHEWLEDSLLPNTDTIDDSSFVDAAADVTFGVANPARFRVGDQIQVEGSAEVMLVQAVNVAGGAITVVRGYGGTTPANLADDATLRILGNAALEGDDADAARFTTRVRQANYTQIFTSTVEVSGSELAVRQLALSDELDYAKQLRLRELMRDLENSVINGRAAAANPEGAADVRRTMKGLMQWITSRRFAPNVAGFPSGTTLTEAQLNTALREIWKRSSGQVDLIVCGGMQKRAINQFIAANRRYSADGQTYTDAVSVYESDYGVCRVVLSRWVPPGTVLLLDSSRIAVVPLAGRSFHYKRLATTGDSEKGQLIGEYTLELRNENAHGVITGLVA